METGTANADAAGTRRDLVGHYKTILKAREASPGLESVDGGGGGGREPDLSEGGIRNRLDDTGASLHQIVKDYLGDRADLHAIADQIVARGGEALRVVRAGDEQRLRASSDILDGLEAIVRTDGSRPSFLVRNDEVDRATSPLGTWSDTLDASADLLHEALTCVGRIDLPGTAQGFMGTGYLIHENLILTNRHVLQLIASKEDDGTWTFQPGATIDFGHEFRAQDTAHRRALRRLVFTGAKPIVSPIDHTKLDLALIELAPATAEQRPGHVLSVDAAPDWSQPDLQLFIAGYPANPGVGTYTPSLLEKLFQMTYGYKRLAPGLVIRPQAHVAGWTTTHDATTLGGNSGSVVLVVGREYAAAGLHYGGAFGEPTQGQPRENWGHVLGLVLDQTDGRSAVTLRQHLANYGVQLVDRTSTGRN